MGLVKYEFIKLLKSKLFLAVFGLLIIANMITLFVYQKQNSEFFYVYQQKENYLLFQQGEASADINGYYQSNLDGQINYISSYSEFIQEMNTRAEKMSGTSLYKNRDSYLYRNLWKTGEDYATKKDIILEADNCYGVRQLVRYDGSILFTLVFLAVLSYCVLFLERDKGLLLLLKGNYKGHIPLGFAKLSVLVAMTAVYVFLQELSSVALLGNMYGYGDLGRTIQSVSQFRNCIYNLTVGEAIGTLVISRVCIGVIIVLFLYAVGMCIRNKATVVILSGAILGVGYLFAANLSISGSLGALKVINPFYCWNWQQLLGEYYNLNVLGWPVEKNTVVLCVSLLFVITSVVIGIIAFDRTLQVKTESIWERIALWMRKRFSFLVQNTGLLFFELYKLFVQQRKWILICILIIWGISETATVYNTKYYATEREAMYHYYMNKISGPITEETYAFIKAERQEIDNIWQTIDNLKSDTSLGVSMLREQLYEEISRRVEGITVVEEQLALLEKKEGDISDKYMIDEMAYLSLWKDSSREVLLWIIGTVAIMIMTCGVYTSDEKRGVAKLLRSTVRGRADLSKAQFSCILISVLLVFILVEGPLFLEFYHIDGLQWSSHLMSDFTSVNFIAGGTVAFNIAIIFLVKLLSFISVGIVGIGLSKITKNEMLAVAIGVGIIAIIAMLFLRYNMSIGKMWLFGM